MPINRSAIRAAFESFVPAKGTQAERMEGVMKFRKNFRENLGIKKNSNGVMALAEKPAMRADDFSLQELAVGICGEQWFNSLHHSNDPYFEAMEDGSIASASVVPGNIANVSAFLGSVTGLLDARVLAGYQKPEYIIPQLIPTIPTQTRQTRMIATGRIGNQAKVRNPGEPHAAAQFTDRRILTPETTNVALACHVTYEAVFFDQTGEVMDRAYSIGAEIGLYEELEGFRVISGVTNNYNYNGVAYNTYLTSGNWINDLASNELLDWSNVNSVYELFSRFTDQETGNRISTSWDTMLVAPAKKATAQHIVHATELETRNPTGTNDRIFRSPVNDHLEIGGKKIASSQYLDQILTTAAASGGLALSQANANKYWWGMDTSRDNSAFIKTENWPFKTVTATPNDHTALDHKIALSVFADRMAQFSVREPRRAVRSKN